MIDILIPSYHRPKQVKTATYFIKLGYDPKKIHVCIDDATDDIDEYKKECEIMGCQLHIFPYLESCERFDYVHRASKMRRSAGQMRNQFFDIVKKLNIDFYLVIDDDTTQYQVRPYAIYQRPAVLSDILMVFEGIKELMIKRNIGLFGLSQTGDMFAVPYTHVLRNKVMNTTFYYTKHIYRGERAVQDNDTSQFVGVMNEGLFTGSLASGIVLGQTASVSQKGGLTELYKENKLLNKSLVIPIQFPSLCHAERQMQNGGRLHHKIKSKYLMPRLMKGKRDNIAWNTYPEDKIFTNEPKR